MACSNGDFAGGGGGVRRKNMVCSISNQVISPNKEAPANVTVFNCPPGDHLVFKFVLSLPQHLLIVINNYSNYFYISR